MKRKYGWVKEGPDPRDRVYNVATPVAGLPDSVDLRSKCPPVYDQGQLGSCVSNALAAAVDFDRLHQGFPLLNPSRLFIYYCARVLEHTTQQDAGATVRDGIKVVVSDGAPPETDWPYAPAKLAVRPPGNVFQDAHKNLVSEYMRLPQTLPRLKTCLAQGFPFVFGMNVYESFESDSVALTGIVPMPSNLETYLGGHCVMAVGYSEDRQAFLVRNSWGTEWGLKGYFWLPYAYFLPTFTSDFWTLRSVRVPPNERSTTMKVVVQPITQPAPGQVLLSLLFQDVDPAKAAKITALAQTIQMAAADGVFTLSEDMMIGYALAMLFSR